MEDIDIKGYLATVKEQGRMECIRELQEHAVSMARNLRRFSFPEKSAQRRMAVGSKSAAQSRLNGLCTAIEILRRGLPNEEDRWSYYRELNIAVEKAEALDPLPHPSGVSK